jgi:hypothetical protein
MITELPFAISDHPQGENVSRETFLPFGVFFASNGAAVLPRTGGFCPRTRDFA